MLETLFYLEFIPTNIFMPNSFHSVLYRKKLKQNPFIERFTIFISRQIINFLQYFRTKVSNAKVSMNIKELIGESI